MGSFALKWTSLLSALILMIVAGPSAWAFFPIGGVDSNDVFRYQRWDIGDFDTNNNGEVEFDEGLPVLLEGGPRGFTDDEMAIIRQCFAVWADVPTSYAQFREKGEPFEERLVPGSGDNEFSISMYVPFAEGDDIGVAPDYADGVFDSNPGVLGYSLTWFEISDAILQDPGDEVSYLFGAGNIVDSDIAINSLTNREFGLSLGGVMTHELGHMLGLGHTPLNNLSSQTRVGGDLSLLNMVENPVLQISDGQGVARIVGATPTMFPIYFDTFQPNSDTFDDGAFDLAPDDMAGVSWLYPRNGLGTMFTVESQGRNSSTNDLPSVSMTGGHVVAWADHDSDPISSRIPVFSTMVGLYQSHSDPQKEALFELIGLWKQMEVPGTTNVLFNPSYTFTMNALDGIALERQAPPSLSSVELDSLQGSGSWSFSRTDATDYWTVFISETFHEVENIIGVQNHDGGTAMVWSFERNTLVSTDTGRSLDDILSLRPMFGDPNSVCPLNVIYEGTTTTTDTTDAGGFLESNNKFRDFRDNTLLQSAIGTAMVDLYYSVSPTLAGIVIENTVVLYAIANISMAGSWALQNWHFFALFIIGAMTLLYVRKNGLHMLKRTLLLALLAGTLLVGQPSHGLMVYYTTSEMESLSDSIIEGEVIATHSVRTSLGQIFTDVQISVNNTGKGAINKGSVETMRVPGGIVNGFAARLSETPIFIKGEKLLLYLKDSDILTHNLFGGHQSKVKVIFDVKTDKNYVPITVDSSAKSAELGAAIAAASDFNERKSSKHKEDEAHEGSHEEAHHDHEAHDEDSHDMREMVYISVEDYMSYLKIKERKERRTK